MKKEKVYRSVILVISLLYVFYNSLISTNNISTKFASRAFRLLSDDPVLINKFWRLLPIQLLTHDLILVLVGISIFYLLEKKSSSKFSSLLVYFGALTIAIPFGFALAKIDQSINPLYFLKYTEPLLAEQFSLFTHLVIRNSIEFVSLFFLVKCLQHVEKTYISETDFFRKIFQIPKSSWLACLIISLIFLFLAVIGGLNGSLQFILLVIWQLSIWTCVFGFLGLTVIVEKSKNSKPKEFTAYAKVYEIYLGIFLSALAFFFFRRVPFGDDFTNHLMDRTTIVFFLIGLIPLLSGFVGYKINEKLIVNRLESLNTQSELSQLKSQINPHFLFNSLNSLYGLALEESSPKTSTGIQKLSEMMRFMLRENVEDKIEISREFEYVENYIELQKLRVDGNEKVRLEYEIDKACEGKITPMLIIPFIENAFKHGVSAHHNSWIEIKLNCSKEAIHLNVKNSNHKKSKSTEEESGIGLENVRQRLAMLYPEKHLFQLFENEESFESNLKIELN